MQSHSLESEKVDRFAHNQEFPSYNAFYFSHAYGESVTT